MANMAPLFGFPNYGLHCPLLLGLLINLFISLATSCPGLLAECRHCWIGVGWEGVGMLS